ncbi:hypothetical protein HYFRA_00012256 [Hymenoscyphus fraxineus]|uniref:Cytochrome b5 heme-binding domain-containing protein n=1 Tax=Hymenoscyphus fraxineus TaxID=746836 RepID=A0A9N9L471_9HELO|nr:hypothetical protein HYFRA_00012256 [Hymenoscyphus fraxineus]
MIIHDAPSITTSTHDEKVQEPQIKTESRGDEDRKAMPPPPPPTFKTSCPSTPRARSHTPQEQNSIPSFTLGGANEDEEEEEQELMPPPQFPALNSAQRAGGSATVPKSIPRLSPMAPPPPRGTSSLMAPPQRGGPLPNRNPLSSKSAFTSSPNPSAGMAGLTPPPTHTIPPPKPRKKVLLAPGLTPPPTHTIPPPKPRKKVLLAPGRSPLDWATLTSSPSANLTGLPPGTPYLKVPPSLLKTMNGRKGKDAWTVLGGRVYNISPYAEYHPGGVAELMRCAGKDGTRMFGEVHPWVNFEGMLGGCLVGGDVKEVKVGGVGEGMEDMD